MSRAATAVVDQVLTNYAQGNANDLTRAQIVARILMPIVRVPGSSGKYKQFNDRNSFLIYDTQRGLGGEARRISFAATDADYKCQAQALDVTIDDAERKEAAMDDGQLEQNKIRSLVNVVALSHAKKVVDFCVTNTTAVAERGNWSNSGVDPVDQLDEQLEALATNVGSTEGFSVVMGVTGWRTFRSHAKVKARTAGLKLAASLEDAKGMLMFPVNLVVGALSYTETKEGQSTVTKSQVIASDVFIVYSSPNPSQLDPSAFKCFTTGDGLITSVRRTRDELARSDVFMLDWDEQMVLTGSAAVKRLRLS